MEATVIEQLEKFIKDTENGVRTQWLDDGIMKVYVRKGMHCLTIGNIAKTLDIAAVEVHEESDRGKGLWTQFLAKAQELNPWDAVYVECVHNPNLASSLLRHGWFPTQGMESYFMPKDIDQYYRNLNKNKETSFRYVF